MKKESSNKEEKNNIVDTLDEINFEYTDEEKRLLSLYYDQKKSKIKKIIISIAGLFFFIALVFIFIHFDVLEQTKNKINLLLSKNTEITEKEFFNIDKIKINMSEIDQIDLSKFIEYKPNDDEQIIIPDINELKSSNTPGQYKLEYSILKTKDKNKDSNNYIKSFYLDVDYKDDIFPVLELNQNSIKLKLGEKFDIQKYIKLATDNVNGDIKDLVQFQEMDTSKEGIHDIIIFVSDSSGNKTEKKLKVEIVKNENKVTNDDTENSNYTNKNDSSKNKDNNNKKKPSNNNSKNNSHLNGKTFLFKDGYNMGNVMNVCASVLSKNGVSGSCIPLYDETGIVIGAKIVLN